MSRILTSFAVTIATAAVLTATQSPSASSSQQQPQSQQSPTFRTEANYVRIDAYPMRDGQPVQDLTVNDFEIFEDGKPQSIQQFEHVVVSPSGPQSLRAEPNTIGEMKQLAANPRNRVFVLFLDTSHVTIDGGWQAREPLVRMLDRILGPDDLVGVMTPHMAASDLVLARKTEVLSAGLRDKYPWGERATVQRDDTEQNYEACFPGIEQRSLVTEMIARKRERSSLSALRELVNYLRLLREERKAILTVTEGWVLYRPNHDLARLRVDPLTGIAEPIPGPPQISVGPDGRLTTKNPQDVGIGNKEQCDRDRISLADMDDWHFFRDTIDDANRGNASLYTIDPRGLAVFDTPVGSDRPPEVWDVLMDTATLGSRADNMRVLAENTDGIAVIGSNNLDKGLTRIANDLTSYYLLGYYSTNAKLDGKYHAIKVQMKQPGIDVRARKGYRSPTEEEVMASTRAAAPPVPDAAAAVASAMIALTRLRPDTRFSMNAVPIATGPSRAISTIWIAGELPASTANNPWSRGGTVLLDIRTANTSETARVSLAAGDRTFAIPVKLQTPVQNGSLDVRALLTGSDPDAERFSDILTVDLTAASTQPMIYRRGPVTGNRLLPAANFQFSRTERAHFEFPVGAEVKATRARLLDKTGQPLTIPVATGERTDDQSQRWLTADLTLAALAAGDYALEIAMNNAGAERKVVTAIRVGR